MQLQLCNSLVPSVKERETNITNLQQNFHKAWYELYSLGWICTQQSAYIWYRQNHRHPHDECSTTHTTDVDKWGYYVHICCLGAESHEYEPAADDKLEYLPETWRPECIVLQDTSFCSKCCCHQLKSVVAGSCGNEDTIWCILISPFLILNWELQPGNYCMKLMHYIEMSIWADIPMQILRTTVEF